MAKTKVTFTLDDAVVRRLAKAAERLGKPKSAVVREAIDDYCEKIGRLGERERLLMLSTFDELVPKIPRRSGRAVQKEIDDLRKARRAGGRRTREKNR